MPAPLFALGVVASAFVAINVGGSSVGVAFGPARGSGSVSTRGAAALLTAFVLLGGATLGPRVTRTLGAEFVAGSAFTLAVSVGVLAVTGLGILLGNLLGVSVSTSQTAVGAVVGLGVAADAVRWGTVGAVVGWWLGSAIAAFWLAALVGRYAYDELAAALARRASERGRRLALLAVACGMAFAAGGSNVANAVGALVGADALGMGPAVALGTAGIGAGALLLGPRTMATVGEEVTDMPVEAALVVQGIAAAIITGLNVASVPASLAVTTTMAVVGLGWGRATRRTDPRSPVPDPPGSGAPGPTDGALYDPGVTRRILAAWVATPTLACALSVVAFGFVSW